MDGTFVSYELRDSGHVEILRLINGLRWRRSIEPHDVTGLDTYAPEITGADKTQILDLWATIPVVVPDPEPVPPTNQELADKLAFRDDVFRAFALVLLDEVNLLRQQHGLANRTAQQLKDAIAAKM